MNTIAPATPPPAMLPIWLNTDAITPVASPSASRREYERMSLRYPEILYSPYRPLSSRLNGLRDSRPAVNTIPTAPIAANTAATLPTDAGSWKPSPSILTTISIVSR